MICIMMVIKDKEIGVIEDVIKVEFEKNKD